LSTDQNITHRRLYYPVIYQRDLDEVFPRLQFALKHEEKNRRVYVAELGPDWRIVGDAIVDHWDVDKAWYRVTFYLNHRMYGSHPIGPAARTDNARSLRTVAGHLRKLTKLAADPHKLTCPDCEASFTTWDGLERGTQRPWAKCVRCEWTGRPGYLAFETLQ